MYLSFPIQSNSLKIWQFVGEMFGLCAGMFFNFSFWGQNEILIPAKICSWKKVAAFWGRTKDTCICQAYLDFWQNFHSHCPLFFPILYFSSFFHSLFFFLTPVVFILFAFLLWIHVLPPPSTSLKSLLWHYFGCKRVICLLWAKILNCSNKKQLLWDVSLLFHVCRNDWKKLKEMSWKFSRQFRYLYLSKHTRCMVLHRSTKMLMQHYEPQLTEHLLN